MYHISLCLEHPFILVHLSVYRTYTPVSLWDMLIDIHSGLYNHSRWSPVPRVASTMSEYTSAGGALKLKSVSKSKKKHKKEKKKKREEAEVENEATEYKPTKRKTSAELAFEKAKRQKVILVVK
ncbi:hypothetical protein EB796_011360 [Bugula neritina]|uniref:Uncharacterized protein n=1 Tax=Bugula neritina TaxID=10212 RepID=A0A7J7JWX2_BUGNE|nr:hypothetical protein EB796_011360 [Bugula neritina]